MSLYIHFAAGIAAAAAAAPDLTSYSYEQWMQEHGVAENSAEAEATFNDNLRKIKDFNAENPDMWLGPNKFMTMTQDEFAAHIKGRSTGPLFLGNKQKAELTFGDLPDRVDWREQNVMSKVKNQGSCGSCWAHSAAQSLESHLAIATGEPVQELSVQQITSCAPNPDHCGGTGGCKGSTQPLAFEYTKTAGITTEANYAYKGLFAGACNPDKIEPVAFNDGYAELTPNNYTELVTAVATKGPIAISVAAGGLKWQFYLGGVMSNCNDYVMDHAVQLVGYGSDNGKDYWLVRNSWGGSWGEKGHIRIQRHGEGNEPCGEDKKPQDGDACEGDTSPRTYCGECAILSASSYPTGMRKAQAAVEV